MGERRRLRDRIASLLGWRFFDTYHGGEWRRSGRLCTDQVNTNEEN